MAVILIWHNPRCSKSRETLALMEGRGDVKVLLYLDHPPSAVDISAACVLLGKTPIEIMRTKEACFKELGLKASDDDETLINAMAENPILIERPIVFANRKAAIGRPPEAVLDIL